MPPKKLAKAGVSKAKFDSCVRKVKGGNPHAICTASFKKSKGVK